MEKHLPTIRSIGRWSLVAIPISAAVGAVGGFFLGLGWPLGFALAIAFGGMCQTASLPATMFAVAWFAEWYIEDVAKNK